MLISHTWLEGTGRPYLGLMIGQSLTKGVGLMRAQVDVTQKMHLPVSNLCWLGELMTYVAAQAGGPVY